MNTPDPAEPSRNCPLCPRLVAYRGENRAAHPDWFNGPAPSFGDPNARLLVAGLAPGRTGANRTGRPFTGDHAGILLYRTLYKFGLASGPESITADDGLKLIDARITNSVKCLPPANKPLPAEIRQCNAYLQAELMQSPNARVILALGAIAHAAVLRAFGMPPAKFRFAHGAQYELGEGRLLLDSYHCSRYNTQTRRLTTEMFEAIVEKARDLAQRRGDAS